jgi:hypothetical protein
VSVIIVLGILSLVLFIIRPNKTIVKSSAGDYNVCVKSNLDRVDFFSKFGWKINDEFVVKETIKIPEVFNDIYEIYNRIQKNQGLNLEKYKGKTCERFVYLLKNYGADFDRVEATVLVRQNRVIGGDISSSEKGGFSHGFVRPDPSKIT